jgi:N-acetylglucosamine-6-phosphate deacetylase
MPLDRYDAALARVAAARDATAGRPLPQILGVHLEGPFLGGAPGAHPPEFLRDVDREWLADLLDRHPGLVRLVTLAPEADPSHDGIRMLSDRGVRVSLGHTACSYDEAVSAMAAGATLATHLFNGMAPLHHRDPGLVGAALDPRVGLTPTVIADGVHLHPAVLAAVFAATEPILVSDAVATDVQDFGSTATARDGAAYLADGTLAGAVALLDDAVRRVVGLGIPVERAVAAASACPAAVLGLAEAPGTIALDGELVVRAAWRDGRRIDGGEDRP